MDKLKKLDTNEEIENGITYDNFFDRMSAGVPCGFCGCHRWWRRTDLASGLLSGGGAHPSCDRNQQTVISYRYADLDDKDRKVGKDPLETDCSGRSDGIDRIISGNQTEYSDR